MGVEGKGSELKGSAPIGMLEQWNTGIMPARRPAGGGSGKLEDSFIGKTLLTRKLMRLRRINK